MTAQEYLAATGRTYTRARAWQRRFEMLAAVAASEGCTNEADTLRTIGARALVIADRYVETLQERIGGES